MPNPEARDGSSTTMGLKTQANELVKTFSEYDVGGRLTTIYTASIATPEGGPCTKVVYEYLTPTSNLVEKMREAAYDENGDPVTWPVGADVSTY